MDFNQLGIQIIVIFVAIIFLWLFVKTLTFVWKLFFLLMMFLALSFILPAVREWIFNIF